MKKKSVDNLTEEEKIEIMGNYFEQTGKKITTRAVFGEYEIGKWKKFFRNKEAAGNLEIDDETRKKLEEYGVLGFQKVSIAKPLPLKERIELMVRYMEETGNKITDKTEFEGYRIGGWKTRLRAAYWENKLKLNEEDEKILKEYGIISEKQKINVPYEEKIKIMKKYITESGKKITTKTVFEGYPIGVWQCNLRCMYRLGKIHMDKELEEQYREYGILIDGYERVKRISHDEKLRIFKKYIKETGQKVNTTTVYEGYQLGEWLKNYRVEDKRRTVKVNDEQYKELVRMGIMYPKYNTELQSFKEKYNITKKQAISFASEAIQKGYENIEEYIDSVKMQCEKSEADKSERGFVASSIQLSDCKKKSVLKLVKKVSKDSLFPDKFIDVDRLVETFHEFEDREKIIIKDRYFQNDKNGKNFGIISKELGISKQRVCQIEEETLEILSRPNNLKKYILDIKDEIYGKISTEIIPVIIDKTLNNNSENTLLQNRNYAKEELKKKIMIRDMCIPTRFEKKLKAEGIENIYDVEKIYATEENRKIKQIIEGCGLQNRIDTIIPKLNEDIDCIFSNNEKDEIDYGLKISQNTKIEEMAFSKRFYNSLKRRKIDTVYDIIRNFTSIDEESIKGIGEKGKNEIFEQIKSFNILFGTIDEMKKICNRGMQKEKNEDLYSIVQKDIIEKNKKNYAIVVEKTQKSKSDRDQNIKLYNAMNDFYYDCENIFNSPEFVKNKREYLEYGEKYISEEKESSESLER